MKTNANDLARFNHVDTNNMNVSQLTEIFYGAEEIYHLGGSLGTVELDRNIKQSMQDNVMSFIDVFEAAINANVKRVFFASKPMVYNNMYTITKLALEKIASVYNKQGKIDIRWLRYYDVFGPGQSLTPVRKVIPTFAMLSRSNLPIEIHGDGLQLIDTIFINDAVKFGIALMRSKAPVTEPIDCGRGQPISVLNIAQIATEKYGSTGGIKHLPIRSGERSDSIIVADNAALEAHIGKLEFTDFNEAIDRTFSYYYNLPADEIHKALDFYGFKRN